MESSELAPVVDLEEEASPSVRASEQLLRVVARLKLRLEVCLRRERVAGEYRDVLAQCLADVEDVACALVIGTNRSVD